MNNKERYKEVFVNSLALKEDDFSEELKYNDIPEWD